MFKTHFKILNQHFSELNLENVLQTIFFHLNWSNFVKLTHFILIQRRKNIFNDSPERMVANKNTKLMSKHLELVVENKNMLLVDTAVNMTTEFLSKMMMILDMMGRMFGRVFGLADTEHVAEVVVDDMNLAEEMVVGCKMMDFGSTMSQSHMKIVQAFVNRMVTLMEIVVKLLMPNIQNIEMMMVLYTLDVHYLRMSSMELNMIEVV